MIQQNHLDDLTKPSGWFSKPSRWFEGGHAGTLGNPSCQPMTKYGHSICFELPSYSGRIRRRCEAPCNGSPHRSWGPSGWSPASVRESRL